jgi:hypothetical protein
LFKKYLHTLRTNFIWSPIYISHGMRPSDSGRPTVRRNSSVCLRLPDANTRASHRLDRGPTFPISKDGVSAGCSRAARRHDDSHVASPGGDDSRYRKAGPMRPRHGTTWISTQRLIAGRTAKENYARPKGSAPFSRADHHACVRADQIKHGPVVSAGKNLPYLRNYDQARGTHCGAFRH